MLIDPTGRGFELILISRVEASFLIPEELTSQLHSLHDSVIPSQRLVVIEA